MLVRSALALFALTGCLDPEPVLPPEAYVTESEAPVASLDTLAPLDTVPALAPPDTLPPLPEGFSRLSEVAPEIAQEMRYTTAYNFVGARIDGYVGPECILATPAAEALRRVAADLAADGLGLKVYDCYRPQRAVDHFGRWARGSDASMKAAFYPDEPRGQLFRRGYIASRSGHSRGATVDLTLVPLPAAASVLTAFPDPADGPLPRCDAPLSTPTGPDLPGGGRLAEGDLDMGTAYDCLDPASATASRAVSRQAQRNRQTLKAAMQRRGFRNYSKEWWHFTFRPEPFPRTYHDFDVQ